MASLDEQKKAILPFLQRADELQAAEPRVAYYCRLYALELGLQMPARHASIDGLLGALMGKLESDKHQLSPAPGDAAHCAAFASTVFERAERADRAGRADRGTAMTYYAASYFFEVLHQFGPLPPEAAARQRFAAWRAADIRKALREGRVPDAPPAPAPTAEMSAEDEALLQRSLDEPQPPEAGPSTGPASAFASSSFAAAAAGEGGELPAPPPQPPPRSSSGLDLPSPPSDHPVPPARGGPPAWVAPPPRTYRPFQKACRPVPARGTARAAALGRASGPSLPRAAPSRTCSHAQALRNYKKKVLYLAEGAAAAPERGTIARVDAPQYPGIAPQYRIALPDRIVTAGGDELAPELRSGQGVVYSSPAGQSVRATVEEVDAACWPPSYLLHTEAGAYIETTEDRVAPLDEELQEQDEVPAPSAPPAPRLPPAATPQPQAAPSLPLRVAPVAMSPPLASHAVLDEHAPPLESVVEAQKLAKSAASALSFEDVPTAVRCLKEALRVLTAPAQRQ